MSDYARYVVLRYPITCDQAEHLEDVLTKGPLGKHLKDGHFDTTYALDGQGDDKHYLDYITYSTYGDECGNFGKIRKLLTSEVHAFEPLFKMILPDVDMKKVKVVDYCYYNGCEPPAYYDEVDDPFNKPLLAPEAEWIADTADELITPGGDPVVVCSRCAGGRHIDGIEQPNFLDRCSECGAIMLKHGGNSCRMIIQDN